MLTDLAQCVNIEDMQRPEATTTAVAEDRRATIQAAGIAVFAENGFAATSMANIADRAGMSRPALYQYFENKEDIFRSALGDAFSTALDAAQVELDRPGRLVDQIDGFLQRYHGDLKELVLSAALGDELLSFKAQHATDIAATAKERVETVLGAYLAATTGTDPESVAPWRELLETAPMGFMTGNPSLSVYRRRLRTLAEAVAAAIAADLSVSGDLRRV